MILAKRGILLAASICAVSAAAKYPVFHGDETALRRILSHIQESTIVDGGLWTYRDMAVVVQLHPSPLDFRAEDVPFSGQVPWRPAWILGWQIREQLTKSEQEVFAVSRVTMIHREQDGLTCVVNELTGERIFKEKASQQNATAVEMPCERIWSQFETMVQLPEEFRREISQLLKTPPAAPKFKRRARSEAPQPSKTEH